MAKNKKTDKEDWKDQLSKKFDVPKPKSQPAPKISNYKKYSIPDSFNIFETFLPNDVKNIVGLNDIDNFYLKLQKAARSNNFEKHDRFQFFMRQRKGDNYEVRANFDSDLIDYIYQNQQKSTSYLSKSEVVKMSLDWRLAIGLGVDNVYETGISLHHLYGVPYIPASSLKGIVRSWIIQETFANEENTPATEKDFPLINAEFRAFQNKEFCQKFGCPSKAEKVIFKNGTPQKKPDGKYKTEKFDVALKNDKNEGQENIGKIIFFDAFPTSEPSIEADIMNPHYPNYYGGDDAPTDFQNPIPINFLTVKDCSFQFIIGIRNSEDKGLLETATKWLKEALTQKGIGAKTAVGYGYMSENQ